MTGHVEKLWESYRAIVPVEASHAQVLETKRAFFAGALAMWNAAMGNLFEEGDEPTDQDMRRMGEIQDELEAFGRSGGRL